MIFSTHSIDGIVCGRKTQTRRIVKPSHFAVCDVRGIKYRPKDPKIEKAINAVETNHRYIWLVGSAYKVQPGRGELGVHHYPGLDQWEFTPSQPGELIQTEPLRIRITRIRLEHDVRTISDADVIAEGFSHKAEFLDVWQAMHGKHYQAWALDFEVVT